MMRILIGMVFSSLLVLSCTANEQEKTINDKIPMAEETDTLLVNLKDSNEQVRSDCALKLIEIGHPYALEACIQTINDAPDLLHLDYTPSVHSLIKMGMKGLPLTVELMLSDDKMTRLRALRVIERVTVDYWKIKNTDDEILMLEEWRTWWDTIGLSYTDNLKERNKGVELLKQWISKIN